MEKLTQTFIDAIEGKNNIVISTHSFPDADGIGSEISLCMALNMRGKNAICCNDEPLLARYKYLDPKDVVTHVSDMGKRFPQTPDLVIIVDTNTVARTGKNFELYYNKFNCPVLYIDHHPCKTVMDKTHCIDTSSAATGQLVGELILSGLKVKFTPELALPLYTAILIDTSSFRYPTVTARTHEMIAKLMDTGIEPPAAYNGIYGTKKIEHMHMLGEVLATTNSTKNEEIAWIVLSQQNLANYDVDIEDTHGFINHLLILDNVRVACMFRDDGKVVKISLRSSGEYDVGTIAIALGGGGHSHSAATIVIKENDQTIESVIENIVKKIEKELKSQD